MSSRNMKQPVWVTGGAGMIGSALVRKLIDRGERVMVLDNLTRGRAEFVDPEAELYGIDLAHPIPNEILHSNPKAIYHLAARVGGVNYMIHDQIISHRNAAIDWNVIEAALHTRAPLLFCSTACVYPVRIQTERSVELQSGPTLLQEDMATENGAEPESIYGWSKLLGELAVAQHVRESRQPWKIVRMFNVYGPREIPSKETGHVIPALIYKMLMEHPPLNVWGTGKAIRAFTFVDDAAEGILAVMERGRAGIPYNIGTSEAVTVAQLARMVLDSMGVPEPENKIQFDPSKPEGVFGRSAECLRAHSEIAWRPEVSLEEGISITLNWCKEWLLQRGWDGTISDSWYHTQRESVVA